MNKIRCKFKQYKYSFIFSILPLVFVTACGGGSVKDPALTTGKLILAITDAPVDGASNVSVRFNGVEVKPASGDSISFDFAARDIDLLSLQGGGSKIMLDEVPLEAGQYNWIRLKVIAEKNTIDSYLQTEVDNPDSRVSLWIPSGSETGLKLNHSFVVAVGGITDFTIDFNLRKSITNPVGQANNLILKPSLRIVDNNAVGEIFGMVDATMLSNIDSVSTLETCSDRSAVYVFAADMSGTDPTDAIVDDVDDIDGVDVGLDGADPITTALVEMAQDETYQYSVAFLSPGFYTIAFTCNAGDDVADEDNSDVVTFTGTTTVEVVANNTTTHNFAPEAAP